MNLVKEDFYCGAFLSYLLNNNIVPALFDQVEDTNRKIYDITTDTGNYRVYLKSSASPYSGKEDKRNIWTFPFTDRQINEIVELRENTKEKEFNFVFVCGQHKLNKSKIAVVPSNIVFQCIDVNRDDKYKQQSIKIRFIKGHRDFDVYGTARADKKNSEDNTLKVKVNNIDKLFVKKL